MRRISVRLAVASFRLPDGLYLKGVVLEDHHYVAEGSYANIYRGRYGALPVALKSLRGFQTGDDENEDKDEGTDEKKERRVSGDDTCHMVRWPTFWL